MSEPRHVQKYITPSKSRATRKNEIDRKFLSSTGFLRILCG